MMQTILLLSLAGQVDSSTTAQPRLEETPSVAEVYNLAVDCSRSLEQAIISRNGVRAELRVVRRAQQVVTATAAACIRQRDELKSYALELEARAATVRTQVDAANLRLADMAREAAEQRQRADANSGDWWKYGLAGVGAGAVVAIALTMVITLRSD